MHNTFFFINAITLTNQQIQYLYYPLKIPVLWYANVMCITINQVTFVSDKISFFRALHILALGRPLLATDRHTATTRPHPLHDQTTPSGCS